MKVMCRFGEMILKSKPVRRSFSRRLIANLREACNSLAHPSEIKTFQAFLSVTSEDANLLERVRHVFGFSTLASVETASTDSKEAILEYGKRFFESMVRNRRFAVRCRRFGNHPFTSLDIDRELGALLAPLGKVDLTNPEITCHIDVRDWETNVYTENIKGAGGLPIGSQGHAVCLISGGIDSPVAAWHALRRGLRLDYLFCCLGGPYQLWGPKAAAKVLADRWSYGYQPRFFVADFTDILAAFQTLDRRYRNVLLKRFFYRAADRLAETIRAGAIITGEVLGQVSSQTISNLDTISRAADRLILRPLITMDKNDIMAEAREIGTYAISEKVPEFCNVAVRSPRTVSREADLLRLEARLPPDLLDRVMATMTREQLNLIPELSPPDDCHIDRIPANALYVWIQTADSDQSPPPGVQMTIGATEIRSWMKSLEWEGPVVLDCHKGRLSRDAASYMHENGWEAYYRAPV
jgi:tRNA uracil 4-sulfurtransferase